MNIRKLNKKGWMQDWLFFGIIILILAIVLVVVNMFLGAVNDKVQASDMGSHAKGISQDNISRFSVIWDGSFMFMFFIFGLGIIVSFYVIKTTPALFFPMIIIFAIILFIIAVIGNVYDAFDDNTEVAASASSFGGMTWIMGHILEIILIFGFVGVVALFAKNYLVE